jgi:hypothetical protein
MALSLDIAAVKSCVSLQWFTDAFRSGCTSIQLYSDAKCNFPTNETCYEHPENTYNAQKSHWTLELPLSQLRKYYQLMVTR